MDKSLSGAEILMALKGDCNLITYDEIPNYSNITELMGKGKKCVLLYKTSENFGHWCCIYEHKGTIYFFDSYGFIPDEQLKFAQKQLRGGLNGIQRARTTGYK